MINAALPTILFAGASPLLVPQKLTLLGRFTGVNPDSAKFSPDGKLLLVTVNGADARLWNVETRKPVTEELPHDSWIEATLFLKDGLQFLVATDSQFSRRNSQTGKVIGKPLKIDLPLDPLTVSSDGELAAGFFGGERNAFGRTTQQGVGSVVVYSLVSGKMLYRFPTKADAHCLQFSPKHDRLVAVIGQILADTCRLWRLSDGKEIGDGIPTSYRYFFGVDVPLFPAVFSSDGKRLVVAQDSYFNVHDTITGERIATNQGATGEFFDLHDIGFVDQDRLITTVSGVVRTWDLGTSKWSALPIAVFRGDGPAAFTRDGKYVIAMMREREKDAVDIDKLALFRMSDQAVLWSQRVKTGANIVAVSDDFRLIATVDGDAKGMQLWRIE